MYRTIEGKVIRVGDRLVDEDDRDTEFTVVQLCPWMGEVPVYVGYGTFYNPIILLHSRHR